MVHTSMSLMVDTNILYANKGRRVFVRTLCLDELQPRVRDSSGSPRGLVRSTERSEPTHSPTRQGHAHIIICVSVYSLRAEILAKFRWAETHRALLIEMPTGNELLRVVVFRAQVARKQFGRRLVSTARKGCVRPRKIGAGTPRK